MERLTKSLSNGNASWNYPIICFGEEDSRNKVFKSVHRQKACEKLAAYEETGLSPEEIERILDSYGRGMTLRTENAQRLEIIKEIPINRLRELAQAEKEGRLVVLSEPMKPMVYKPNDTDVYCPSCGESLSGGWPLSDADDLRKLCQCPNCGQSIDDTRCEAAEAALEAQRGENNA